MNAPRKYAYIIFTLIVVLLTFIHILNFSFLNWDDPRYVINNPQIRSLSLENLTLIFITKIYDVYSPLTTLSFALEYRFFRLNPFYYHLTNLLLHLGIVFLVYILALRLGLNHVFAAAAALIFGAHPIHVETLTWVTERKGLLYTFFYLFSVIAYSRFLKTDKKWMYLVSVLLGLLSVLAKPMALSLPLILCLCDWWAGRKNWKVNIMNKVPFCLYIMPVAWITFTSNQDMYASGAGWGASLLICVWSFTFYLIKFFWPFNLAPVYELPLPVVLAKNEYVLSITILIMFVGSMVFFRKNRWIIFAGLFYVFNIFYLVRFDLVTKPDMVSDRYMYLASVGFCVLIAAGAQWFWYQIKPGKMFALGFYFLFLWLVLVLAMESRRYSMVWSNSHVFWNYVINTAKGFEVAYHNRALLFIEENNYPEALRDLNKAVEVYPRYANAYFSRAVVMERMGNIKNALDDYQRAREINPVDHRAYNNLANIWIKQKNLPAALTELNLYLNEIDKHPEIYVNRGLVYKKMGDYERALADLNEAIRLRPDLAQAYNNRANIFKEKGDLNQALSDYNNALRHDPGNMVIKANKEEILKMIDGE